MKKELVKSIASIDQQHQVGHHSKELSRAKDKMSPYSNIVR